MFFINYVLLRKWEENIMNGIIYFLGWVFVIILALVFLLLFVSVIIDKRYCSKCGKYVTENILLWGNRVKPRCLRCNTRVCRDIPIRFWDIKRFVASFIFWKRWAFSANKNA